VIVNPIKRAYLALESWFNLSFGTEWNPLYHLGTLSFFLFWIILITGLYLFVPYNGSIAGAFASVEYITHEQWYVAGIMRSLHRYASDAVVITVLLHMFKEFASGRYRGFRWFSWVTGIPNLWMLVTLGITGYWLVWDELAQYVAVGSAQLMDALPIFSGAMTRNFVSGGMTDRFFILIEFLHLLGQPMLLMFMLWIHVKRLSNVNINPPRGLAVGTLVALLALSLVAPATSHAGGFADEDVFADRAWLTPTAFSQPRHTARCRLQIECEAVPALPVARGAAQCGRAHAADDDGRVRLLDGSRLCVDPAERDEAALEAGLLLRPERQDRLDVLVRLLAAIREGCPDGLELGPEIARADAEDQAPAREHVDTRQLLREDDRVALRKDDDPGAE